jgi:hypothetical protein
VSYRRLDRFTACPRVVDGGVVEHVEVVILDGFTGFQGLERDALDHRVAPWIGEYLFSDFPLATVGGCHCLPQHSAFVDLTDIMLLLLTLLVTPCLLSVGDQKLQIDVLHVVESGVEHFGQDTLGTGEVDS